MLPVLGLCVHWKDQAVYQSQLPVALSSKAGQQKAQGIPRHDSACLSLLVAYSAQSLKDLLEVLELYEVCCQGVTR